MTKKQKQEAVKEFLLNQWEETGASMVKASEGTINLVDQHYLSAMMMSIKILIDRNNERTNTN
jgi:hypothetical protein